VFQSSLRFAAVPPSNYADYSHRLTAGELCLHGNKIVIIVVRPHRSTVCTGGVVWCVGWSVCYDCEPCKNGCTDQDAVWGVDLRGPKNHVLDRGPDPHARRGDFEGEHAGYAWTCPSIDILKTTRQGAELLQYGYRLGVLGRVHIGTTWQIRLNHLCVAAMRPYVKLLWQLVIKI